MFRFAVCVLLLLFFLIPGSINAHGVGEAYVLPLPLWLYLWGSAACVLFSFLVIVLFFPNKSSGRIKVGRKLFNVPKFLRVLLKIFSVYLLVLTIISGIFGSQNADKNFSPNFFWSVFVFSFVVLGALLGNWWRYLNPVLQIFTFFEKIFRDNLSVGAKLPKQLSSWPAVFFYFVFVWVELVSGISDRPSVLSFLIVIYVVFLLWGLSFFNKTFINSFGFLTVFANLLSKISPLEYRDQKLYLVNPLSKVLESEKVDLSKVVFIIFTLSGVAFDSFSESPVFYNMIRYFGLSEVNFKLVGTLGFLSISIFYLSLYVFFIYLGKLFARSGKKFSDLFFSFSLSLLPISVAYFIAHYFPLFTIGVQKVPFLMVDPFGLGWIEIPERFSFVFLNATLVWYGEIVLIVIGHVFAIIFAHNIALNIFKNKHEAFVSQFPVTALMIVYTVFSLWLLSAPIVISP